MIRKLSWNYHVHRFRVLPVPPGFRSKKGREEKEKKGGGREQVRTGEREGKWKKEEGERGGRKFEERG